MACASITATWSGSDLARLCRIALRREVVDGIALEVAMAQEVIRTVGAGIAGSRSEHEARAAFCALAVSHGGLSQREVARLIGVSHPTVGRLARQWNGRHEEGSPDGD